ncbi:hypothetical protein ACFYO0_33430 [Streptomyces sp. NPDC006365]|uniref:hypothetical protein n=1 Tax=Streptomyces sp. NPDC006365 TaxID=3364744 RepID=UPI0036AE616F
MDLESGADWQRIAGQLRNAGAEDVLPPRDELPDHMVAILTDDADAEAAAQVARSFEGVADAYPDEWKFAGPQL